MNQEQERFGADVEELPPPPLPPHHVQAATVHQRSELMQADLRGVQDPLDLLQTSLERTNKRKESARLQDTNLIIFGFEKADFHVLFLKLSCL